MSQRYVSEPLKTKMRAVLSKPRTIQELADALDRSTHQVRFCLDAVGAVKTGTRKPSKGAGRPWDLWGLP